jgi:glycosyl transferase family 2
MPGGAATGRNLEHALTRRSDDASPATLGSAAMDETVMSVEPATGQGQEREPRRSATVSVIIPAFRAARYIGEAIDSVLAQTFTDVEIIVINDASPDTPELEQALERFGGRVKYLKRDTNGGPGAARNTGILAARGTYLAFLDGDDYWDPAFLAEQLPFFERHPDVSLVYSDASWFVEGTGEIIGTLMTEMPSRGEPTFDSLLRQECTVGTSAVVVRRQAVFDAGLFDPAIGNYSEDFDLYLRLAKSGARLAYQRKLLVHHRVHPQSLTAEPLQLLQGVLRVLRKTAEREDLTAAQRESIAATRAKIEADLNLGQARAALGRGDFAEALERATAGHAFYRTWKLRVVMLGLRLCPGLLLRVYRLRDAFPTGRAPRAMRVDGA